jgi:hypothetical protein
VGVPNVPLKLTAPLPWLDPKFVPVIVTEVPTAADVVERLVMLGAATTVNFTPFVLTPLAVTMTFPVVAPDGTVVTIELALQLATVAFVPLNSTLPVPWLAPKFDPEIVTDALTAPDVGDKLEMLGVAKTVKLTPFVFTPLAFTTTFPVVAPEGTLTTMLLALQLVTEAVVPLNLTVALPCEEPKFEPAIVTEAPTAPEVSERLVMLGVARMVKLFPLLAVPETVTTTFPVVAPVGTVTTILLAPQFDTVAVVPLNLTVLLPCDEPKFDPAIVTDAPAAPDAGVRLVIEGELAKVRVVKTKTNTRKTHVLKISQALRIIGTPLPHAPSGAGRIAGETEAAILFFVCNECGKNLLRVLVFVKYRHHMLYK